MRRGMLKNSIFYTNGNKENTLGRVSQCAPVKLFIALLYHGEAPVDMVLQKLDDRFGARQHSFGPIPFSWTDYYSDEMGHPLFKLYYNYEKPVDRSMLPGIKTFTNSLEQSLSGGNGNRMVNIDPGYVSRDKVVLATTKDFYHRLYLAEGIFGEVTLHYRKGRFRHFSWTYPDFREPEVMRFLERVRAPLVKEIRTAADTSSPDVVQEGKISEQNPLAH